MEEAERIAREEHGSIKLAVISGEYTFLRDATRLSHRFSCDSWLKPHTLDAKC